MWSTLTDLNNGISLSLGYPAAWGAAAAPAALPAPQVADGEPPRGEDGTSDGRKSSREAVG